MADIKKIILATDLMEGMEKVSSYALSLAIKYGAKIDVVHVIHEPARITGFYVPHISFDVMEKEMAEAAHNNLKNFCNEHLKGKVEYDVHIRKGMPFDEILKASSESGADIIVMGTEGKTGLEHAFMGSTAERVLRKSPVPVLTIKTI